MSAALKKIRAACCKRASGACEACGAWVGLDGEAGHADHMQGRARAPEKLSNCWALHRDCHTRKTNSDVAMLEAFIAHCIRHSYTTEQLRAESRLVFVQTRAGLGVRGAEV